LRDTSYTTAAPLTQLPLTGGMRTRGCAVVLAVAAAGCVLGTSAWALNADTSAAAPPTKLKIFKYIKAGTASFSDVPPTKGAYIVLSTSCYACNLTSTINWQVTQLHRDAFAPEIGASAQQFGLDPALVRAVIHAESGFNPAARSRAGAVGLMQLMPGTARMMGVTDSATPSHNIQGGARYLASLLARFKNDISLAAAAYNAGPEAVQKYAGIPPYAETQTYVQRVRILYQRYRSDPHS
jgi:soluble lytic murein transglycosylase-like protein